MNYAFEKTQVFSEQKFTKKHLFPIRNASRNNKLLVNLQSVKRFCKEFLVSPRKGGLA